MQQLTQLTEHLASAIVITEATDLPALAAMHSKFLAIKAHAAEVGFLRLTELNEVSDTAEKTVEKIILREVDDADAAVRQLAESIAALQQLVNDAAGSDAEHDVVPAAVLTGVVAEPPAGDAEPAGVPTVAAEPVIGPDDLLLVGEFVAEARGHLEAAEAEILKLEETPDDLEAVNAVFRSFHTIKGVAGFINLKQIGALAHAAENLLDLARHATLRIEGPTVDVVLEALDLMKLLVESLSDATANNRPIPVEPKLPAVLARVNACAAGKPVAVPRTPPTPTPVRVPPKPAAPTGETVAVEQPAGAAVDHPTPAPAVHAEAAAKPAEKEAAHGNANTAEATVKVATDRLDSLINMVGELVIAQSMVSQDMTALAAQSPRLVRNIGHLGKLTRELQDLSMSMRMIPIQGVFQKMARLVRDLGRKFGKEIDLVVVGGETELDRNVVEAISDPLVHMVRNSVDHGLETPEARLATGKPSAGRVELKAYHQSGNIVIDITDDGRGLNKARIVKKATEAGIVRDGQELSEQEIFKLIFHAGLSTAEKLTDVSGRGVGMDVVRKNVEALRGRIDISSVEGKGSTFSIRLPLTLAVIDGMVVRVGTERYIIPITSIEQSLRPKPEQLSTVQNRGELCMVRGDLLPLYRLHRLFNVTPRTESPSDALVVIIHDDDRRVCLMVDELLGQQQVVIKSLGEGIHVTGISGGAILGDGNVSLILDVPSLLELGAGNHAAKAA